MDVATKSNITSLAESKKRKFSMENLSGLDVTLTDDSLNKSQMVPTSPWEVRRLKADLIDNDTKVHTKRISVEKVLQMFSTHRSLI